MSKPKKTKFQFLQEKWYAKLAKSGFEDIEKDERYLKKYSNQVHIHSNQTSWEAKAAYFQMASNFLEDYKFASNLDRTIWEYHANGLSLNEIAATLKKVKPKSRKITRDIAFSVIKALKFKMYTLYMQPMKEYHESID